MPKKNIFLPALLLAFVLSWTYSLHAEGNDYGFSGNFRIGYRFVDTSGAEFKYKEDINLDNGVRLFDFNLSYSPSKKFEKLFDRLNINIYNYGGDPFESFRISLQKYGRYNFQYDRRKSAYFYHDLHEGESGELYDLHTFDFERIADSGMLKIWLGSNAHFYLNFDRYTKKGDSITTFDINRIEFEFDKPIREDSRIVTIGVDANLKRYSFVFEEKIQDYESSNTLFLPGFADSGPNARYPSSLSLFLLNQPYDLRTETQIFKINANPIDNLLIAGSALLSDQDTDFHYSEEAIGIDFFGNSFTDSFSGEGGFGRQIQMFDLDVTYLLFNRLAIIGGVSYHDFEQNGSLEVDDERETTLINFDTLGIEGGLQYQFSSKFELTLGYRYEERELEGAETVTFEERTIRHGIFGNLKADLTKILKLTVDYQYSTYDDPYTLISPTNSHRFRATAKLRAQQFSGSGSFLWNKSKSEIFEDLWESTRIQLNLRAGYHGKKAKVFGGYAYLDVEHKGDRIVAYPPSWSGPASTFPWNILYEGKSHLLDAMGNLQIDKNWRFGGYANYYKNNGYWEILRVTLKGYFEYMFDNGFLAQFGYRYVDLEEASSGFNDYKANIFEVSFGYRWE